MRQDLIGAESLQSKEGDRSGEKGEELFFDLFFWWGGAGRDATGGVRHTKQTPLDVSSWLLLPAPAAEIQSKKVNPKQMKRRTWGHGLIVDCWFMLLFKGRWEIMDRKQRWTWTDTQPFGKESLEITAGQEGDLCLPEAAIRGWTREGLSLSHTLLRSHCKITEQSGLELLLTALTCQYWIKRCSCALINSHLHCIYMPVSRYAFHTATLSRLCQNNVWRAKWCLVTE